MNFLAKRLRAIRVRVGTIRRQHIDRYLAKRGLTVVSSGGGYIDAVSTIQRAESEGLTVCDYLESRETEASKVGRRDRIVDVCLNRLRTTEVESILEIGSGTGMYLEAFVDRLRPSCYEVYETDVPWRSYLKRTYGGDHPQLRVYDCDGRSLRQTQDSTVDLVHAHGVFVYLSSVNTAQYIQEMARVCRPGGSIVFDIYVSSEFTSTIIDRWIRRGMLFPVLTDTTWLRGWTEHCGLTLTDQFDEVHGASSVRYLIFEKRR